MSTGETKEPTTTTATLDDAGGGDGGGGEFVKSTPSLASRLNKRASLLQRILSFHETRNPKHYINLRSSSKLFHRALPQPPPLWTSYPNSNHATLQSLVDRLEQLRGDKESSGNVPSVLFIEEGEYVAEGDFLKVKKPVSIYGAGCGKTTLVGVGLYIMPGCDCERLQTVVIEDLTLQGGEGHGLSAGGRMKVILRRISVEGFQKSGVRADYADISCDDLQVVGCGESGVCAGSDATITLSGPSTTIQGNVTKGDSETYGLDISWPCSKIQLIDVQSVSFVTSNNGGGGNWGGDGTIEQINNDGVVLHILYQGVESISGESSSEESSSEEDGTEEELFCTPS
jgi:hypothetical protein